MRRLRESLALLLAPDLHDIARKIKACRTDLREAVGDLEALNGNPCADRAHDLVDAVEGALGRVYDKLTGRG